jgi:hypothetical protein
MSGEEFDLSSIGDDDDNAGSTETQTDSSGSLIREIIEFCGGPDLIELFGPSGSGKSEFAVQVAQSALQDANKDVLFIDTERNIGEMDRIDGADYVYIPEWHDIYSYVNSSSSNPSSSAFGENTTNSKGIPGGYDVVVLDSIGFPALIQYGKYRVADDAEQFKVFNELQVITGELKKYAQKNEALVIVTNQPKSDLSDADDPDPFGDKSIFGFKEVWKTDKASTSEIRTKCEVNAFRSRQSGKGKSLFQLSISDEGVDVTSKYNESVEDKADDWTA